MNHLLYRLATVGLLTLPLALGSSDAHSAKKQTAPSDTRNTTRVIMDSSRTTAAPTMDVGSRELKLHVEPAATAAPAERVTRPTSAGTPSGGQSSTAGTAAIENNWISINHGGATEVTAGNLKLGISIAQPVAGYVEAGNYQLGLGYWYGAAGGSTGGCDCPYQSDFNKDGVKDNVDLNIQIDILFFNGDNIQDPDCPAVVADFNCDGVPDNLDLNWFIDYLFYNGVGPCQPCDCASYPGDCPPFP